MSAFKVGDRVRVKNWGMAGGHPNGQIGTLVAEPEWSPRKGWAVLLDDEEASGDTWPCLDAELELVK